MMTQAQLASVCQRTCAFLQQLILSSVFPNFYTEDLTPLAQCSRLSALVLSNQNGIKDLTPLSHLAGLRELRLSHCNVC
jgi:hypothetical protein